MYRESSDQKVYEDILLDDYSIEIREIEIDPEACKKCYGGGCNYCLMVGF